MNNRLIKSNDAGGGACTNTVDLYNPFPDGGGLALYQLNGDATDVSGNYDGTATNVTYGTGQFGQAGVFNGSAYITATPQTQQQGFSWSFWVNYTSTSLYSYIASVYTGSDVSGVPNALFINSQNNGALALALGNNGSYVFNFNHTTTGLNDGQWHQVVVSWDGTTAANAVRFYIDNVVTTATSSISAASLPNYSEFAIGARAVDKILKFTGSIDQVRIFNRALRPYEVEALYTEEYCTPTIVPSEHFNTVLYTGSGSDGLAVTGTGFSPDFVWIKPRTQADNHNIYDTLRGVRQQIIPNNTSAESTQLRTLQSFDSDGFTLNDDNNVNNSGIDYVSWNFKAGGAAVTNTDGTITSQVSANTEAGFSVVSYEGNGVSGATVGHGLIDSPSMIIIKNTVENSATGSGTNWRVYHKNLTAGYNIMLNQTNAQSATPAAFTTTPPSSTVFTLGNFVGTNATVSGGSAEYIAYCFAEVEGFSNFGSYVGNGSASGPTVITGFEPAFVMIKWTGGSGGNWQMMDNKRGADKQLYANLSNAEGPLYDGVDFLANGFQLKTDYVEFNGSGQSYIYMAFAADPTAVEPSLEDSFNTVTYTGNGGVKSVTGVGFQPDFTWIKHRNGTAWHNVNDSVRGSKKQLYTNSTAAETSVTNELTSFDNNGFTLSSSTNVNGSGLNYVAWNWKGAEIPAINSNGSIPSVVSANPAAGFSIVKYNLSSPSASDTIGHGLGVAPSVIITKGTSDVIEWYTYHKDVGTGKYLRLENAAAAVSYANGFSTVNDTVWQEYFTAQPFEKIAYCFAEVAGFSKFGSYTGNGVARTIALDFTPAFVMIKRTGTTGSWQIFDNKRSTYRLTPNYNFAESQTAGTNDEVTLVANGFTLPTDGGNGNNSALAGNTYIYMAFANQF